MAFYVASTEEGKARVAKSAADNYVFNERKMLDASHVVVFCAKTAMDDAWLKLVVDQEDADGRFATPEAKAANDKGRKFFADMHRKDLHDGRDPRRSRRRRAHDRCGALRYDERGGAGSGRGAHRRF